MLKAVPLIELPPRAIEALLAQEVHEWRTRLLWDFTRTADRLLFLAELRLLAGLHWWTKTRSVMPVAKRRVHIEFADFYVLPHRRSIETNTALFKACIEYLPAQVERADACSVRSARNRHDHASCSAARLDDCR